MIGWIEVSVEFAWFLESVVTGGSVLLQASALVDGAEVFRAEVGSWVAASAKAMSQLHKGDRGSGRLRIRRLRGAQRCQHDGQRESLGARGVGPGSLPSSIPSPQLFHNECNLHQVTAQVRLPPSLRPLLKLNVRESGRIVRVAMGKWTLSCPLTSTTLPSST